MKGWFYVWFPQHLNILAGLWKITLPFIVWNMFPGEREYVLVFISEHIFMFKLQRKWEESIKQEASVFLTGRASGIWCDFNIFPCLLFTDGLNSKVLHRRKWVETGKTLKREGGRKKRRKEGREEGRKEERERRWKAGWAWRSREAGRMWILTGIRNLSQKEERRRARKGKGEGKADWGGGERREVEDRSREREGLQNFASFPYCGLEIGLRFQASGSAWKSRFLASLLTEQSTLCRLPVSSSKRWSSQERMREMFPVNKASPRTCFSVCIKAQV